MLGFQDDKKVSLLKKKNYFRRYPIFIPREKLGLKNVPLL
jgi:hypothetical protein